jgi:3-hydroxyacyl-CoA dehydrogenase/enoyl-CoA hydratase/3-hydroxybutyryl-CoA epimerase
VIEAVFEDRDVKKAVTESIEAQIRPTTVYASNTSTLPITGLAKNSKRPKNFIGIHFFSPVDKMMLVEIILGRKTSDKALAVALDYVAAIKKTPIVVNDTRGFFVNRCVLRYMNESYNMLAEGVPPAMIENAAKMAGMPVGPLSLNDEVAIDLSLKIVRPTIADLGEKAVDPRHLAAGRNGWSRRKAGWAARTARASTTIRPSPPRSIFGRAEDALPAAGCLPRSTSGTARTAIWLAIALEAVRTVEEGIVTDPREADLGTILGFGFAPYTGGALSYIDSMGAQAFVDMCKVLARKYGKQFKRTEAAGGHGREGRNLLRTVQPLQATRRLRPERSLPTIAETFSDGPSGPLSFAPCSRSENRARPFSLTLLLKPFQRVAERQLRLLGEIDCRRRPPGWNADTR